MKKNYNYSYLRGKIVSQCGTIGNFAKEMNMSKQTLSAKLNNKNSFSQEQIDLSIDVLKLNDKEVRKCFFSGEKIE